VFSPGSIPDALCPALADVRSLCAALGFGSSEASPGAVGVESPRTAEDRASYLVALRQLIDAAEVAFTGILADFDANGDGETLHAAPTTPAWLRGALGLAAAEAGARVKVARASRDLLAEPLTQAADTGGVCFGHVESIARATRPLPADAQADAVTTLTEIAAQCGVDDVRAAGRYLRNVIDPDGALAASERDFERRWLDVSPLLDGMTSIQGVLDAEASAVISSALAPFLVPAGPDDERSASQRRADGLVEMARVAVMSGDLPTLSGTSTALAVTVPLSTLTGKSHRPGSAPGTTAGITWLTSTAVGRLSCDATVRRVLLDPAGIPFDLGREKRVFTAAQRAALALRDTGCRFPGCVRPPVHTDAHHLVPWAQGGSTDIANGLLLCRFHHRQVHEGGWTVEARDSSLQTNGELQFRGPRGQLMLSRPPPSEP
jgi:hypothetical protein